MTQVETSASSVYTWVATRRLAGVGAAERRRDDAGLGEGGPQPVGRDALEQERPQLRWPQARAGRGHAPRRGQRLREAVGQTRGAFVRARLTPRLPRRDRLGR